MITFNQIIMLYVSIGIIMTLVVFILYKNRILSWFKPSDYSSVTLLESDNNVKNILIKKPDNLKFKFNHGSYNLFESKVGSLRSKTAIYRNGRLGHFIYIEGNENPIDLRGLDVTGNPQLNEQILKQDLSALWIEPKDKYEAIKDILIPILVIIGIVIAVIVIVYAFSNNPTGINPQGVVVK